MTKIDDDDFENSTKCWIYDVYVDGDIKARHHSSITGEYTASANRGNIYISTEHSINHLHSKINDKKAYIKNFKMFVVVVTVHKND